MMTKELSIQVVGMAAGSANPNRLMVRGGCGTEGARESFMRIDTLGPVLSTRLVVIATGDTVQTAAIAFSNPRIGLLVACDENGKAVGVVSKSDLVSHLTTAGVAEAPVATLMSRTIVSCGPDDDLYAVWEVMAARSLQNMPVLSADSRPLGVLDVRDALKALLAHEEYQERLLANYIAGIGYQ